MIHNNEFDETLLAHCHKNSISSANDNEPFSDCYLNPLDLEQFDVCIVPYGWFDVSQIYNAPHVCAKPCGRAGVSLIPPDEDRMRHWQQPDKGTVLQELQDLALICQPSVKINKREHINVKTITSVVIWKFSSGIISASGKCTNPK